MPFSDVFAVSGEWIAANLYRAATAFVVLALGWLAARLLSRWAEIWLHRVPGLDNTIAPLLIQVIRYGILAVTLTIVLSQFGVQTASILAVLGAAGLAIALALQGTLSNIAAGIMLLWLRPFSVGEYVDGEGVAGTVVMVSLFNTRLRTYDGVSVFVPNSRLWSAKITNFTREPTRMIETKVGISYGASIEKAREIMLKAAEDPRVLKDPAPRVYTTDLAESSVQMLMRCWVQSSDWWETKNALTEQVKLSLDAAGIEIPYNKLDINLVRTKKAPAGSQA
jgi:small conductance mechanosensitive channel